MDQELKDILTKLLEGQMRLETEVGTLKEGQMRLEVEVGTIKEEVGILKEGQMRLEVEVGTLKEEVGILKEGQMRLEVEVGTLKEEVGILKEGQIRLETEVRNNTVKLEVVEKKIDIVAEVQTAHSEQNERRFNEVLEEQRNVNSLLMSSLKHVSDDVVEVKEDVKELKENFHKVEKVTMQNTYDVAYLKAAK